MWLGFLRGGVLRADVSVALSHHSDKLWQERGREGERGQVHTAKVHRGITDTSDSWLRHHLASSDPTWVSLQQNESDLWRTLGGNCLTKFPEISGSEESAVHEPEILSNTSSSWSTTPFSTAPIFLFFCLSKGKNTFCNCDFKRSINMEDYMVFNVVVCTIYMSTKMQ